MTLWERFAEIAGAHGAKPAIHDTIRTWTYAELHTRAEAIAALRNSIYACELPGVKRLS